MSKEDFKAIEVDGKIVIIRGPKDLLIKEYQMLCNIGRGLMGMGATTLAILASDIKLEVLSDEQLNNLGFVRKTEYDKLKQEIEVIRQKEMFCEMKPITDSSPEEDKGEIVGSKKAVKKTAKIKSPKKTK